MSYYTGINFYGNFGENEMFGRWPAVPSEKMKWVRPELAINENQPFEMEIYVDDTLKWLQHIDLNPDDTKYRVCVLVEPKMLIEQGMFRHGNQPNNYELIENPAVYEKYFDLIFTTYPHYQDLHPKFRYFEGGIRSFIKEPERKIHPKTSGIVCIMSNKKYMPGHILRHQVRDKINQWMSSTPKWGLHTDSLSQSVITYNNPPETDKHLGTKDFMFELIIENEQGPFFSEKLIDCMLVGSVPIYWTKGLDDVSLDVFDRNGIITFDDISELFHMLENYEEYFNVDVYKSKMKSIENNFKVATTYSSMGDVLWKCGIKDFVESKK